MTKAVLAGILIKIPTYYIDQGYLKSLKSSSGRYCYEARRFHRDRDPQPDTGSRFRHGPGSFLFMQRMTQTQINNG